MAIARALGFYKSFLKVYRSGGGLPERWLLGLTEELTRLDDANISPLESIHESLDLLGISPGEYEDFFPYTVLALRGWASMIRQMDVRGDRFAIPAAPGTLTEFLAIRLILERFAIAHVAETELGYDGSNTPANWFGSCLKATAQVVLPLDTMFDEKHVERMKTADDFIKITVERLFRVNGTSAQRTGVIPDIFLPDFSETQSEREKSLPLSLPNISIEANKYYHPYGTITIDPLKSFYKIIFRYQPLFYFV